MSKNKYACKLVGIVTIELLLDKLASYSSRFCTRWNRKTVQPHLCTGVLMNNGSAVLFHELACEHNVPVWLELWGCFFCDQARCRQRYLYQECRIKNTNKMLISTFCLWYNVKFQMTSFSVKLFERISYCWFYYSPLLIFILFFHSTCTNK